MTKETIIAYYKATKDAPRLAREFGVGSAKITVTAQAYLLGGNQHPHFSVTGDVRGGGQDLYGGCIHEEVLRYFPEVAPLVKLHLSNADDGAPMHAVENGYYFLCGAIDGNFGELYHAGNSKRNFPLAKIDPEKSWITTEHREPTHAECLQMVADHLRIDDATPLLAVVGKAFYEGARTVAHSLEVSEKTKEEQNKAGRAAAKIAFAEYVKCLKPQWQSECDAGIALLKHLSSRP